MNIIFDDEGYMIPLMYNVGYGELTFVVYGKDGSITTLIVANKYGVSSVGIEKNDIYYELCKKMNKG